MTYYRPSKVFVELKFGCVSLSVFYLQIIPSTDKHLGGNSKLTLQKPYTAMRERMNIIDYKL